MDFLKNNSDPHDDAVHRILQRPVTTINNYNCLALSKHCNLKKIFNHPTCQTLLTKIWFGQMKGLSRDTFWISLAFLVPPFFLILLLVIPFRRADKAERKRWYYSLEVSSQVYLFHLQL